MSLVREAKSSTEPYSRVLPGRGGKKDISLILDREEYDPLDVTSVAIVRFKRNDRPLDELRLRLELRGDGGATVSREEVGGLRGEQADVTLALADVPPGNCSVHAVVLPPAG